MFETPRLECFDRLSAQTFLVNSMPNPVSASAWLSRDATHAVKQLQARAESMHLCSLVLQRALHSLIRSSHGLRARQEADGEAGIND